MTDRAWRRAARTRRALDQTGMVRATGSGRKMSDTEPRDAPYRSASGVRGQTPALATNTPASIATSAAALATLRSRRPTSPLTTSHRIDESSTRKTAVWTDLTTMARACGRPAWSGIEASDGGPMRSRAGRA
jgi:hypothetical protein